MEKLELKKNFSLKEYNTFSIDVKAKYFYEVNNETDLVNIFNLEELKEEKKLFLGEGSNILFTKDFDGLVLKINLKGLEKVKEDNEYVFIKAGAGNIWHDFVLYCIDNNWAGIENLSLIPGTVGASPIQNIGAYGVEIKDIFDSLEAIEIDTGKKMIFEKKECHFGYRNSVFKNELKNKFVITSVIYKLKKNNYELKVSYGDVNKKLQDLGKENFTIKDVSNVITEIRQSKLPNPKEIGNAGSFFKNPEIDLELFEKIKKDYPEIPFYKTDDINKMKIPAGWLIEKCGWKGKTFENYGVHKNQALVLVNYGNAKGEKIKILSEKIKKSVLEKFLVELETEVNIF
ncbi:MAG: UDP-N-acetylmuramate dehydrogenase [Candidatus Sericytochromatia bacterium]